MKRNIKLILLLLVSMFAFNMSARAYSFPADGQEHEISAGQGQGSISNCYAVSDNIVVRYDSAAKKCYAKSKTISESGFKATIHVESSGGAYGGYMNSDQSISVTSASGTPDKSSEVIAQKDYYANGEYFNIDNEVTGGITNCEVVSGNVSIDRSSPGCKFSANSDDDMTAVFKVTHGTMGSTWTSYVTVNMKGKKNIESGSKHDTSRSYNTEGDTFEICDPAKSPQTVAAFKLIGIVISIIKIVAPIIIIVAGMLDVSRAVFDNKDDNIKKQLINFLKRSIACLLIFFAPSIILDLFHFIDGWDEISSGYDTCIVCILGDGECPDVNFTDLSTD